MAMLSVSGGMAQHRATGTVTDASGETLPGVSIVLKGTGKGTVTNADGRFSIPVAQATDVLVFSFVSYEKVERPVDVSAPMLIVMHEEATSLEEVVVIGYQDVLKRDLTGAVGKAGVADMLKAPVPSFDQALAGRVAGVNVSSGEGMPGATMNIVVRGNNSITQNNLPLYIVDGFPVEDPSVASTINPNDIESIHILKDASATAIYGSRGANGVIIVTTKKGRSGSLKIAYDGTAGMQSVSRRIPMMDAYEFIKLQSEIYTPAELAADGGYFATVGGKTWSLEDYRHIDQYDWQDMIFRDAFQQNHSVSLTGGAQDARYNASTSYFNQDGALLGSNYSRAQGRLGTNIRRDRLNISLNTNWSRGVTMGSSPSQSQYSGMNNLFYSVWGYRPVTQAGINLQSLYDNMTDDSEGINPSNDYRFNPILSLLNEYRKNANTYIQYNGFAEYEVTAGLKLKISGGYTVNTIRTEVFNNSQTRYGSPASTDKVNSSFSAGERTTWLNENTATYQKLLNKKHYVSAVAGMSLQESAYDYYSMGAIRIPNEQLGMAGMSQGTPTALSSSRSEWAMLSWFGRANYHFRSRYYFTASFRADGSSKFAGENRFGYFPSGSVAWTFTEEDFMKSMKPWINSGKFRLSWGQTGNNRVGEYDTYARLSLLKGHSGAYTAVNTVLHGVYPYNNDQTMAGAVPYSLGNKDLKWETTTQTNAGLDLSLAGDRIDIGIDWYRKTTSDLLLQASLVPSSGYLSAMKNIGKVQNQGWELTVNTTNVRTKNFRWNTNFNISFNRNKVLELAENQTSLLTNARFDQNFISSNYVARVNYPIGMMYGFVYDGVYGVEDFDFDGTAYTLRKDVPRYTPEANTQPGYPKYVDLNGDGLVDDNDQTIIGRGEPLHVGGFTNNFEYRNFDLSIFFQWSYGNHVLNANRLFFESSYNRKKDLNQYASYADRFILNDPATHGSSIPVASTSSANNVFSSRLIEDGSYLRLKTLSFGYTLPARIVRRAGIDRLRVFCSMQNLLTFTRYTGYDPEVSVRNSALTPGLDFSAYPRARSVNFGVNMVF
jgi:TonB-linked SusC/RagA family outer membrane protein